VTRSRRKAVERAAITIVAALASASWVAYLRWIHPASPSDLSPVLWGAQGWLHGESPYDTVARSSLAEQGLLYPFTAVLLLTPFAAVSPLILNVGWVAVSAGALAWMLTKRGISPALVMLVSPSMMHAVQTSQWTPLLTAAVLSRWGGALLVCKPTTAAWLLAYRPRSWHVWGSAIFVLVSLALWPTWPAAWAAALTQAVYTIWPLKLWGAPLVLLALFHWRRPEARLLVTMTCVPHTPLMYETLPLFLVPRTWVQAGWLWAGSVAAAGLHGALGPYHGKTEWARASGQLIVWCMYIPALLMIQYSAWMARERERASATSRRLTTAASGG
jgi:hypothetical protein